MDILLPLSFSLYLYLFICIFVCIYTYIYKFKKITSDISLMPSRQKFNQTASGEEDADMNLDMQVKNVNSTMSSKLPAKLFDL